MFEYDDSNDELKEYEIKSDGKIIEMESLKEVEPSNNLESHLEKEKDQNDESSQILKISCKTTGCRRKVKSASCGGTTPLYCEKCSEDQRQEAAKKEMKINRKETSVTALFGMHLALYMNLELLGGLFEVDLKGLPKDLIEQQEEFKVLYGQLYEQYGPELIDDYVGPGYALALMTCGQIGHRYVLNQNILKKSSPKLQENASE